MIEKICNDCGKQWTVKFDSGSKYCRSCARKHADIKERKCDFCGLPFTPASNRQRYCDRIHKRECPVCGKEYIEDNAENLKRPPIACSYECRVERTRETSVEKYGCKAPGNNPEARQKAKETCVKNNGVEYAMQSPDVQARAKASMMERYGVDNAAKNKDVQQRKAHTCLERYGPSLPFNSPESYKKQHDTMQERYSVPYYCMTEHCMNSQGNIVSKNNKALADKLAAYGISYEFEFRIKNRSYDIALPEQKILIEVDPTYTHNSFGNHWDSKGLDKYYHKEKSELAAQHGYRCIHVFDWDDIDRIVESLKPRKTIYARNCTIYRLNLEVANQFLSKYHFQSTCRGQLLCLGLVQGGELYQVMTFGKPRYDRHHSVELLRLCTEPGHTVVGGASRLFKFATENYGLSDIISYCDLSKFSGNIYEKIGMTLVRTTPPQEIWSKNHDKITANLLRQRGYDQLFSTNYGKGTSNEQLMIDNGWLPVYDCGQAVYEFK